MVSPVVPRARDRISCSRRWLALAFCFCDSGCSGVQSALAPGGEEAAQISQLFWTMAIAGTVIWLGVTGLFVYASRKGNQTFDERIAGKLVFWCGAVVPSMLLFFLLSYILWLMPGLRPLQKAADTSLRIEVTGEQFWWRIKYLPPDGSELVLSANEIRLPVGERVEFQLTSTDVIHSFWIPSLGGKMDMIPGRQNRVSLLAQKSGTYRAACAEYCGTSHALMAFTTIVMESQDFRQWLAKQAKPSPNAESTEGALFLQHGCGACHRVAGTAASGNVGPDLSHVGSRATLGAGILPNSEHALRRFISHPQSIKPGSHMPNFSMLPAHDIDRIANWLKGLD